MPSGLRRAGILHGARAAILETGAIDAARLDAAVTAFEAWGRRPGAALWYGIFWAEGIRPD